VPIPIALQQQLNQAISGIHQRSDPLDRARTAGELMEALQRTINDDLSKVRREAVAEAVQWPNMSMAKVALELNLSKSTIAKLATPDIRVMMANDLRTRLARGFDPPSS
jgi:DNA-binding MurR/RpiR family transcriptional regulator